MERNKQTLKVEERAAAFDDRARAEYERETAARGVAAARVATRRMFWDCREAAMVDFGGL